MKTFRRYISETKDAFLPKVSFEICLIGEHGFIVDQITGFESQEKALAKVRATRLYRKGWDDTHDHRPVAYAVMKVDMSKPPLSQRKVVAVGGDENALDGGKWRVGGKMGMYIPKGYE